MRVIVDAMGGDNAPRAIVEGAILAAGNLGISITLVGREADIMAELTRLNTAPSDTVTVLNAAELIDMHDDPVDAIRVKKDSSMVKALNLLSESGGDALVSAGSTGALLTGATLIVKRTRGVRRAAVAPILPSESGGFVLIDSGANVECTAEMLLQFAYMGSIYAETALGKTNPRVALLNNGSEDTKGDPLRLETYKLLKKAGESGTLNFIGNVEGRDPMLGGCDVAVTDGYSGNIYLKASEGAALFVMKKLKSAVTSSVPTKFAALLMRSKLKELKNMANPDTVGGTVMLGISKPVIKAHGGSGSEAIVSAIRHAVKIAEANISDKLSERIRS